MGISVGIDQGEGEIPGAKCLEENRRGRLIKQRGPGRGPGPGPGPGRMMERRLTENEGERWRWTRSRIKLGKGEQRETSREVVIDERD